jgi:hypothetical protein
MNTHHVSVGVAGVGILLALLACKQGEQPATKGEGSASPAVVTVAAPAVTVPAASAAPSAVERSAVPTLEEWNAMKTEVTVKGSSALGCETKMVREYLRVSCRGKNDTGGTPTQLRITRGGAQAMTFVGKNVTSLVTPFVEGTELAVDFSWTDKSHRLEVSWPRRTPRPIVVGTFRGASSPLDAASASASPSSLPPR